MNKIILYKHQIRLIEQAPIRRLLAHACGSGKTLTSIFLSNKMATDVLVICPKALKENWKRELAKHSLIPNVVLTKEEFKKKSTTLAQYDAVIVDEAHAFAGMRNMRSISQMSKCLGLYFGRHNIRCRWLLTATPYLSTPFNIFRLAALLGHEWSYTAFKEKFFMDRWLGSRTISIPKPNISEDISKLVAQIGDIVSLEECADVPEQVFEVEYFKHTDEQKRGIEGIKQMESNPVVKYSKIHQIDNGALKSDGYVPDMFFESDKFHRIAELAQSNKKLAVFCRYLLQMDRLKVVLQANKKKVLLIRGDTPNRDEVVQEAERLDDCVVLISTGCCEGYQLPSFGVIIFASLSFSYMHYKQGIGRFLRIDRLKKNVYITLVNADTVDEAVFKSIQKKSDFDLVIYSKEHERE